MMKMNTTMKNNYDLAANRYLRKEIRYCDILVWVVFGMMIIIKFLSIFLFVQVHEESGVEIEAIVTAYEANSLMKILMSLQNIGYVLLVLVLPASAMAFYYYMRRKVKSGKVDVNTLTYFVQFAFFLGIINIVNDGAALLSKLIPLI